MYRNGIGTKNSSCRGFQGSSYRDSTVNNCIYYCRSSQRKQSKRPDIPIYIPKALRGLANNTASKTKSTNSNSDSTASTKLGANSRIQDDSSNKFYSKDMIDSISNYNQRNNIVLTSLDSFNFVDLSNEMLINDVNDDFNTSYHDDSSQLSDSLSTSILPNSVDINENNSNSSATNKIIKIKNPKLDHDELESDIVETVFNDHNSDLTSGNNDSCINFQKTIPVNLPDCQTSDVYDKTIADNVLVPQKTTPINLSDCQIPDINDKITADDILVSQKMTESIDLKVNDKISGMSNSNNQLHETHKGNEVIFSDVSEIELKEEHDTNCPHYCLNNSFSSGPLADIDTNYSKTIVEELTVQQSSVLIDNSEEVISINEKKKNKKKEKKKVLDVNECSWEDMYDKEDDYIHPLLMKEVSYFII